MNLPPVAGSPIYTMAIASDKGRKIAPPAFVPVGTIEAVHEAAPTAPEFWKVTTSAGATVWATFMETSQKWIVWERTEE